MTRTTIGALTCALGLTLAPAALAQPAHLERVPGVFRDLMRSPQVVQLPLEGDEEGLLVEIGFPFSYYGQTFTQLGVTTNGYVTVGTAVGPDNDALPSAALPNGVLAPFWDDLDSRSSPDALVLMERTGEAGARVLTIQWHQYALKADPAARLTFQVLLFEGTNEVLFHYGPMKNGDGSEGTGRASGSSATIGFESPDGSAAVPVAFEQAGAARPGLGYAFLPRPGAPLPEGRRLGDLDGDGRVTILDQSRQVELTSARYRPASALELVTADVAPLDSHGAVWGDGTLRVSDRDLISQVIVERVTLAPYLSNLLPDAVAPLSTLTVIGSGFDVAAAGNNVVVLPRTGGGTLEVAAATVDASGSRLTLALPQDARRGATYVKVGGRRTNERILSVAGVPAILAIAPAPAVIGETLAIGGLEFPSLASDLQVTIGGVSATVLTVTAGPDTGLGATRIVTVQIPTELTPGQHPVVVATGTRVSEPVGHTFGDLPVVAITSPVDDAVITDRVPVIGTVQDADLARYELAYAPLEGGEWVTFFTGTGQVTDGELGTFDPTMLLNGYYRLRLRAVDVHGLSAAVDVTASVQGNLKLGHFTLAFADFELPASGIAIRVVREYDSRDKKVRDFGVGWALSFVTLEVQEGRNHSVIVDNPESSRIEFRFDPQQINPLDPRFFTAQFVASDGSERSSIDFESPEGVFEGNHVLAKDSVGNLLWFPESIPFDPQVYRITNLDGTVLRVHDEEDLLQVIKPTGVTLTITPGGIIHSGGRSVLFTRDGVDRITKITDPNGNFQTYEYDDRGDLVRQTDALGFASTFTYLPNHHLSEWFDPRGVRATKNEYDDAGRLVATIDPLGNRLVFESDLDRRREVVRDKLGRPTITEYDARGRATKIIGPDGNFEAFTHDARDLVLTRLDLNGHLWTYEYDAAGNQKAFTDPEGRRIEYTYDAQGHILSIRDADGGLTTYAYDGAGNVIREEDAAAGVSTRTYNANGDVTSVTDEGNETTRYDYNALGDVVRVVEPNNQVTLYTVDQNGNVLTETKVVAVPGQPAVRATTTYAYNAANQRSKVTRADGTSVSFRHGEGGRVVERSDSDGRRELFAHDDLGRLKARIGGDGRVEHREYDVMGNTTAIVGADGRREGEYDVRGRLTRIAFPDGSSIHNEYDAAGRRTARIDGRGQRWTYEHDRGGRLVKEIGPDLRETTYAYNGKGQLTSRTDADARTTTYEYDGVGRLLEIQFPDGRTQQTFVRDPAGHVTSRTDLFGRTTDIQYGTYDRQTRVGLAAGAWTYAYDELGRLLSQTDANNRTTSFRYDALTGKRTGVTLPLGQVAAATWRDDRPASLTDYDGQTTRFEHDGRGQLTYRVLPDGTGERLTYDDEGRLRRVEDVRGETLFVRDTVGRVVRRSEPDGRAVAYRYDGNGNVLEVQTPAGTISYSYDARDRLASVTDVSSQTTTFTYTPGGVLREVDRPGGIRSELTTDPMGRLETLTHIGPSGLIAGYAYEYDAAGLRSRVTESPSGRTVEWQYDADARLASETVSDAAGVTSVTYAYDTVGNRLSRTTTRPDASTEAVNYVYDANDRLLREDVSDSAAGSYSVTYTYDASGRTLGRTAPDETTTFAYDGIGRLTSAVVVRGAEREEIAYRYDHFGHRIQSVRNGVVTNHLVDTNRPLSQVLVDTDAEGQVVATYTPGAWPVSQRDASGTTRYLLSDGQLSTRHVVGGAGAVLATFTFDAYGVLRSSSGASQATDQLFASERYEPITGLYHLRSRYLDPRIGRFVSRDTFEGFPFDPPTLHPYVYALNNPTNRIDPPGTFSTDLNCVFNLDLKQSLAGLDLGAMDVRARIDMTARIGELLANLNVFVPGALDVIRSDRDLAIAYALVTAALEGDSEGRREFLNARTAPGRAARTYLFGSKIYGRMGSDVQLALARSPGQDAKAAYQHLVEDDVAFGGFNGGSPEPVKVNSAIANHPLFKEIGEWLASRQGAGELADIALFEAQRDSDGNQVGFNHPHLAFTVTSSNVRWNMQFASSTVPTLSEVDRILRNDPRCVSFELRDDATLGDFLEALRSGADFGPPARFILSFSRYVTESGLPVILKEAIPERNKRLPLSPSSITAGVGIYAHSGEFTLERSDLKVQGRGLDWEFRRTYRSGVVYPDTPTLRTRMPLGHGWTHNYDYRIGNAGAGVLLELDPHGRNGDRHSKALSDAGAEEGAPFSGPPGIFASVAQTGVIFHWLPDGATEPVRMAERGYLRRAPNGMIEGFNGSGWLVWQRDRHGNELRFLRDETHALRLVIDTVGRRYRYDYAPFGSGHQLLTAVVDETGGRTIRFDYDPVTLDLLAVTSPGQRTERYDYSAGFENPALNHNMTRVYFPSQIADPRNRGVAAIENVYQTADPTRIDFDGVIEQRYGGTVTVDRIEGATLQVASGGTTTLQLEEISPLLFILQTNEVATTTVVRDRRGNRAFYEFNRGGNPVRVSDELGFVTSHRYNEDGLRVLTTFPNGQREYLGFDTRNPIPTQRANLVWQAQFPAPGDPSPAIVTEFDYDPMFNQTRRVSDTEAFLPVTEPPPEGIDARTWLVPSAVFDQYTNWNTFDYQEGSQPDTPLGLLFFFGFNLDQLVAERTTLDARWRFEFGRGDVNGDGEEGPTGGFNYSGPGFRGLVVEAATRPVRLSGNQVQRSVMLTQYNAAGQVTRRVDAEGNATFNEYYEADPLDPTNAFDPLTGAHVGYLKRMTSDAAEGIANVGRTSPRPPVQAVTTFAYDAYGNAARVTDSLGSVTLSTYDPDGVQVESRRGAQTTALNYLVKTEYDANLRPTRVLVEDKGPTSVAGRFFEQRIVYDLLGDAVEEGQRLSPTEWLVTSHEHDQEQQRKLTTFPEGNQVAWEYDVRRLRSAEVRGPGTAQESIRRWAYDKNKNVTSMTLPDGDLVLYRYDGFNRLKETITPNGSVERRFYDPVGKTVAVERWGRIGGATPTGNDEAGNVLLARVEYLLDAKRRPIEERFSLFGPGLTPETVTWRTEYDRMDRPVEKTDPEGQSTTIVYDGLSRTAEVEDSLGNRVENHYDANGNLLRRVEVERASLPGIPDEMFETTLRYDTLNRLVEATDSAQQTTRFDYDSRDNVVVTTDAMGPLAAATNLPGNRTESVYDAANRPVETIHDLTTDGLGGSTLDTSNAFNPDGQVRVRYHFDKNSRLSQIEDDSHNLTTYVYDVLDRRVAEIYADATRAEVAYNADDTIRQITDPNGTVIDRSYDSVNRLTEVRVTRAPGVAGTRLETYEYDGLDRLTKSVDDNGSSSPAEQVTIERVYDSLSRLLEERQGDQLFRYGWSQDGKRLSCTYPGGRALTYGYDAIDRMTSIADSAQIASADYVGPQLRTLRRQNGNGTILSFADDPLGPTRAAGYDTARRVVSLKHHRVGGGAPFVDREYAYNRANRRTEELRHDDGSQVDRYDRDSLQRIVNTFLDEAGTGERREPKELQYLLDGVGNRREVVQERRLGEAVTVSYTVNALNQYVTIGTVTRTHSASGNLQDDGRFKYEYDYRNRLVGVRRHADNGLVARYRYDTDNRRVAKLVYHPVTGALQSTTRVLFDGWREVEEQDAANDRSLVTYVYGPVHMDEVLHMARTEDHPLGAAAFYLHQDVRGNVVAVTDSDGVVVERRFYDDYGNAYDEAKHPTQQSNVGNAYGFQGRRLDAETGLYYFRNRYYDPGTGRFLQRDPVWDAGNLGNQYTFAWNDPGSLVDPTGEFALLLIFATASTGFLYGIANSLQDDLYKGEPFDKVKALEEGFMGALVGGAFGAGIVAFGFGAGAIGGVAALFQATTFAFSAAQFAQGSADMAYGLQTGDGQMAARGAWDAATAFAGGTIGAAADVATLTMDSVGGGEEFDNCFLAGTLVAMADGSRKPIEQVRAGDRVKACDPLKGEVVDREVVRTFRNVTDTVVDVTWAPLDRVECMAVGQRGRGERHSVGSSRGGDGEGGEDGEPPSSDGAQTVRCTPGHPWWVESQQRWVFAGELSVGDLLKLDEGRLGVVLALEVRAEVAQTFNFEVEREHTYFVSGAQSQPGALVHNTSALRRLAAAQRRSLAKAIARGKVSNAGAARLRLNREIGAAGERELARRAAGTDFDVIGSQLSVRLPNGQRRILDILGVNRRAGPNGMLQVLESKTGGAVRSGAQELLDGMIAGGQGRFVGQNTRRQLRQFLGVNQLPRNFSVSDLMKRLGTGQGGIPTSLAHP